MIGKNRVRISKKNQYFYSRIETTRISLDFQNCTVIRAPLLSNDQLSSPLILRDSFSDYILSSTYFCDKPFRVACAASIRLGCVQAPAAYASRCVSTDSLRLFPGLCRILPGSGSVSATGFRLGSTEKEACVRVGEHQACNR